MEDILLILDDSNADNNDEPTQTTILRHLATQILSTSQQPTSPDPATIKDLLLKVIKPLFAESQHASITSTGRKAHFQPPTLPNRFGNDSIFDAPPPWKTKWTIPLLRFILTTHSHTTKPTLESDFYLLIPPLLHLLDDEDLESKITGCKLLSQLSTTLHIKHSDILQRTGLAAVFVSTLTSNFHHLPTLTPEDESLKLLSALYPAYLSVVNTGFVSSMLSPIQLAAERAKRQTHLSTLLRSSLLYSLSHLESTPFTALRSFLLHQIPVVLGEMDINAARHLQNVVPVLVGILRDPFAGWEMVGAAVRALKGVVCVCWVRVRERWWGEVLSGLVAGWLNVGEGGEGVRREMMLCVVLLGDVVGEELGEVVERLVDEEQELEGLFDGLRTKR